MYVLLVRRTDTPHLLPAYAIHVSGPFKTEDESIAACLAALSTDSCLSAQIYSYASICVKLNLLKQKVDPNKECVVLNAQIAKYEEAEQLIEYAILNQD